MDPVKELSNRFTARIEADPRTQQLKKTTAAKQKALIQACPQLLQQSQPTAPAPKPVVPWSLEKVYAKQRIPHHHPSAKKQEKQAAKLQQILDQKPSKTNT